MSLTLIGVCGVVGCWGLDCLEDSLATSVGIHYTVGMATKGLTKHTCNGGEGPYFGRKTEGCPRCDELLAGDEPRSGWQGAYFEKKQRDEEQSRRSLDAHFAGEKHRSGGCGLVCTFGDW